MRDSAHPLVNAATRAAGAMVVGGLFGTGLVGWALPRSPLPLPTGPHPVGTIVDVVHGRRDLPVQVWYPAARLTAAVPMALFPQSRGVARAIGGHYGVPPVLLRGLGRVRGNAVRGLACAEVNGVVVIAHGWMGMRMMHVDLAEQLASDGWVVVAADHVGGALATQYPSPDGRVLGLQAQLMPPNGAPDYIPRTRALIARFAEDLTDIINSVVAGQIRAIPARNRVWLVGQSTGGGAAVKTAVGDDRVRGLVGLDPWVEPVAGDDRSRLDVPMIAVRSGQWVGNRNDGLLADMPTVERRAVPLAGHTDLTMLGYLSPLTRMLGLTGCDPALPHDAAVDAFNDLTRQKY